MEEEKKEKGFVIKDRRHFDESGSIRKEETPKEEEKKPEAAFHETKAVPEEADAPETDDAPLPEINFASFLFSLSTTAMYHFGDFPDPDILSILKTKTEGNLAEDEKQLLEGILYELQMRFVKEMTKK
jgi:hypothetical protein